MYLSPHVRLPWRTCASVNNCAICAFDVHYMSLVFGLQGFSRRRDTPARPAPGCSRRGAAAGRIKPEQACGGHCETRTSACTLKWSAQCVICMRIKRKWRSRMAEPVYWDPLSHKLNEAPAALYRRLRDEEPVYFNDRYGFYALSRYDDVYEARLHPEVFSNSHSVQFERLLDPKMPLNFINDMDPPVHTRVRKVIARQFTHKRMARLEDYVRAECAGLLARVESDDA